MTTNNAINSPINLPAYSLTPYIVGIDNNSQYTTISAAIAQAVSDGAQNSNPKVIHVKPGAYVEDLTLSDGIYVTSSPVIGFNAVSSAVGSANASNLPFKLNGKVNITQSSTSNTINCGLSNCELLYDTASNDIFNFSSASGGAGAQVRLYLCNVYGEFANVNIFGYSASDTSCAVQINAQGCSFVYTANNSQQFFDMKSSLLAAHTVTFRADTCFISSNVGLINTIAFGGLSLILNYSEFNNFFITHTSAGTFGWTANWCAVNKATADQSILISNTSATATLSFSQCSMRADTTTPIGTSAYVNFASNTSTSSSASFINCFAQNNSPVNYITCSLNNSSQTSKVQACTFQNTSATNNPQFLDAIQFNGINNLIYRVPSKLQTTDASSHLVLSLACPVGTMFVEADIYGCNAANTDFYSAKLVNSIVWNGTTAVLGTTASLAPVIATTATASITNTTNTINVNVQGVAATTWNWSLDIKFMIKN